MSTEQTLTPAQELRAAASKIGEAAGAATPGPWVNLDRGDRIVCANGKDGDFVYVVDEPLIANPDNGEHIAMWHPGMARLIGDWLESEAYGWDATLAAFPGLDPNPEDLLRWPLRIARAINGEVTR